MSRPETGDLARQWAGEGTGSVSQRQGDPQPATGEPTARRGGARPPTPEGEHLHLETVGPEEGKKGERGQG